MNGTIESQKQKILSQILEAKLNKEKFEPFESKKSIQSPAAVFFENPLLQSGVEGCALYGVSGHKLLLAAPPAMDAFSDGEPRVGVFCPLLHDKEIAAMQSLDGFSESTVQSMVEGISVSVVWEGWVEDLHGGRMMSVSLKSTNSEPSAKCYSKYLELKSLVEPEFTWPELVASLD